MTMSSSRPYIMRALYDWILDNECTPYVLVNASFEGVDVPLEHVRDGQIIFNISPNAVHNLSIQDLTLEFDGRFAGVPRRVEVPIAAVKGIYAKENGQGMIFDADTPPPGPPQPTGTDDPAGTDSGARQDQAEARPALRLVK